jgi:hypothetical protein
MSRYALFDGVHRATVPYAGSFWADAETADLVRIEVRVEDVLPPLTITSVLTRVDYVPIPLGETSFLLPGSARMVMRFLSGVESINRTEFRNCRVFTAESELSFGDESGSAAGIGFKWTREDFELPPGISLPTRLDTEIDSGHAAVGDRIEATLQSAIENDGKVLAPKGSRLVGRIRRLERFTDPEDYFVLALELHELHTPNRRAHLRAELVYVTLFKGLVDRFGGDEVVRTQQREGITGSRIVRTTAESYFITPLPGTGELYIQAKRFRIRPGLHMVWKTQAANP